MAAPDNIDAAADLFRTLGGDVTIERRRSLQLGTDEVWTVMAHAGGGYGFGQGGSLRDALADFAPATAARMAERVVG